MWMLLSLTQKAVTEANLKSLGQLVLAEEILLLTVLCRVVISDHSYAHLQ